MRYIYLDLVRGVAALAVLFGHLRALVFVDYSQVTAASSLVKAFYFATGFGHQAVMVFFVLSGFLIGKSVIEGFERGWSWRSYAHRRLCRLWVVLLPSLILTLAWDSLVLTYADAETVRAQATALGDLRLDDPNHRSAITFAGNLFFLQTILVPTLGSNAPLWSLANEFWYYVLFPVGYLLLQRSISLAQRLIYAATVFVAIALLTPEIWLGFGIWLTGVLLYWAHRRSSEPRHRFARGIMLASALIFVTSLLTIRTQLVTGPAADYVLGISTALLIGALLRTTHMSMPNGLATLSKATSAISYSLYLVHLPFGLCVATLVLGGARLAPTVAGFAIFGTIAVSCLCYSIVIWWLFEARTDKIRTFTGCLEFSRKPFRTAR